MIHGLQHNLLGLSCFCRFEWELTPDMDHSDLLHVLLQQFLAQRLGPHIRRHILRIHMEGKDLVRLHVYSEERSLHDRMLVPGELTIVGAQPDRRKIVLVHASRSRHLVAEER